MKSQVPVIVSLIIVDKLIEGFPRNLARVLRLMCILFLSYQPLDTGTPYVLIVASNRDEFFERKTTPAAFWQDHPTILAGY